MTLSEKTCVPCSGGIDPLTYDEAASFQKKTPNWRLIDGGKAIWQKFTFRNFKQALAFVNHVGEVAEAEQHHPDITFSWGVVELKIQTHAINGLHENDFILAAKIDRLKG